MFFLSATLLFPIKLSLVGEVPMRETASQFSHVWRQLDLRGRCCSWGVGELLPPAEEQAEEAYAYGNAVGPEAEEDLALGDTIEGKGLLVHVWWSWSVFGELRLGADWWVGRGVRSSVGAVVAMSLAKWASGMSAPAVVPVDLLPIGLRPR